MMVSVPAWFFYSIIVLVGWGFWAFFAKMASGSLMPRAAALFTAIGWVSVAFFSIFWHGIPSIGSSRGVFYALLAGVMAGAMILPYTAALRDGDLSTVVAVTSLYPVVTMLLAMLLLHETLSLVQWVGVLFALMAVVLIQHT